jgi:cytochrome c biogenesis protein CcdA
MLLLIVSFIAGILTILAPCVLPVLPVILGSSVNDKKANKRKTLTIILSLGISVILFTLLLKVSTLFIDIPEYTWKIVSGIIILILGLVTIFPSLWENKFIAKLSRKSNIALGKGDQKKSFWGDVIVGASLGPVFSTCSPTYFIILATVLPVSPLLGLVYLLAYALGLCLALFAVALVGQRIVDKLGVAANPDGWFKKTLGIIFVIVAIGILTGADKKLQTYILDKGFFDVTKIEQRLLGEE